MSSGGVVSSSSTGRACSTGDGRNSDANVYIKHNTTRKNPKHEQEGPESICLTAAVVIKIYNNCCRLCYMHEHNSYLNPVSCGCMWRLWGLLGDWNYGMSMQELNSFSPTSAFSSSFGASSIVGIWLS